MASMMFKKDTMFKGSDNYDQLVRIVRVLGEDDLYAYCKKYGLRIPGEVRQVLSQKNFPRVPWETFITTQNKATCPPEAIDLLDKMLRYDRNDRIRPKDAMEHKYFDPIREYVKKQVERGLD